MFIVVKILAVLTAVLVATGCSSSTNSDNGTPSGFYLTATIDGTDMTANSTTCLGTMSGGNLVFAGGTASLNPIQFNISVPGAESGKTFTTSSTMMLTMVLSTGTTANDVYQANMVAGTGSVTITKLTSSEAEGTFTMTGRNTAGTTKQVTNGKFRVNLSK